MLQALDDTPRTTRDIALRVWIETGMVMKVRAVAKIGLYLFKNNRIQRIAKPVRPGGVPKYHYFRK